MIQNDENKTENAKSRPKGYGKELNKPDYKLMAKVFLNIYKELSNEQAVTEK